MIEEIGQFAVIPLILLHGRLRHCHSHFSLGAFG